MMYFIRYLQLTVIKIIGPNRLHIFHSQRDIIVSNGQHRIYVSKWNKLSVRFWLPHARHFNLYFATYFVSRDIQTGGSQSDCEGVLSTLVDILKTT